MNSIFERAIDFFYKICVIPHGSGDMEKISQFCVDFANEHGLKSVRDEANNVVIFKSATKGYENYEPIILQGHLDMVCQSVAPFDFLNNGITLENGVVKGTIDVLDIRFGSLWTNIPRELFKQLHVEFGDRVEICIEHDHRIVYKNILVYAKSFADVSVGETLMYTNSLDRMAVAINQGSFAKAYNVGTGTSWKMSIRRAPKVIYE